MRVVIQRVSSSSVKINGEIKGKTGTGLVILAGFEEADTNEDLNWLSAKIVNLRIFSDDEDKMNLSIKDVNGDVLLISQFTLHASTKNGNRPAFLKAAKPPTAIPLYNTFISHLEKDLGKKIARGEFGADMKVELVNDGPVTIVMDSKQRE
jgi:D-aminoacyl-tRNA deacylase